MKVIFFDGYCGLCNGFIDFMMKIDKRGIFQFCALQSDFAKSTLKPEDVIDLKSLVVLLDGKTYRKSKGVLLAVSQLGGPWKLLLILGLFPTAFSDWIYDLVAKNRYTLFGKRDTCRLPTPEEKMRFIV